MEYVTMTDLSPMECAALMLYAKMIHNGGQFINPSLADYPADWEYVPEFPMQSDDVYMTVGELYQAITIKVAVRLESKNNGCVNADALKPNLDMLIGQASEMLRTRSDDLYVCKLITPCGRYLLPFLFTAPNLSAADSNAVRDDISQEKDEAAARNLITNVIANHILSYHFRNKFGSDVHNLTPALAQKILNTTDQVMLAMKKN